MQSNKLQNLKLDLELESSADRLVLQAGDGPDIVSKSKTNVDTSHTDYIAPEIITDKAGYCGKLADLWSCGVILYAMLAGEFPFENASHILKVCACMNEKTVCMYK